MSVNYYYYYYLLNLKSSLGKINNAINEEIMMFGNPK